MFRIFLYTFLQRSYPFSCIALSFQSRRNEFHGILAHFLVVFCIRSILQYAGIVFQTSSYHGCIISDLWKQGVSLNCLIVCKHRVSCNVHVCTKETKGFVAIFLILVFQIHVVELDTTVNQIASLSQDGARIGFSVFVFDFTLFVGDLSQFVALEIVFAHIQCAVVNLECVVGLSQISVFHFFFASSFLNESGYVPSFSLILCFRICQGLVYQFFCLGKIRLYCIGYFFSFFYRLFLSKSKACNKQ